MPSKVLFPGKRSREWKKHFFSNQPISKARNNKLYADFLPCQEAVPILQTTARRYRISQNTCQTKMHKVNVVIQSIAGLELFQKQTTMLIFQIYCNFTLNVSVNKKSKMQMYIWLILKTLIRLKSSAVLQPTHSLVLCQIMTLVMMKSLFTFGNQ